MSGINDGSGAPAPASGSAARGAACFADEHYMLPPGRRLGRLMEMVEDGLYFTLHAARQTGKTTSVQWLTDHYEQGERFRAVWFDLQIARDQPELPKAFTTVLDVLDAGVRRSLSDGAAEAIARIHALGQGTRG